MEQAGFSGAAAEAEETETEADTEAVAADAAPDAPFTAGTYSASAAGINSDVTVTVTFDENNILAVGTYLEGETAGIGADIGTEISGQILEAQSADIDGVSGATVTSDAVKAALADCIAQATGAVDAVSEPTEDATEAESEEDVDAVSEPTEDATEAESEEVYEETELASEAEYLYKGEVDEDTQAPDAPFVAGTYTASAKGISSDVTVTVVVNEARIISVEADVTGETAGIGAEIEADMVEQILVAQSADVDGISGATVTSEAIKTAVADCLAQAKDEASVESESELETESESETE
jgi:uncharacterized protein with FMN-binding domain